MTDAVDGEIASEPLANGADQTDDKVTVEASPGSATGRAPIQISLIVPMYGVEKYLPEFLESLAQQLAGPYAAEFIFVDDGSLDNSAEIARLWLDAGDFAGTVVSKENGGVSSARNLGLSLATGDWVTFPDPDDMLQPEYLREIAHYINSEHGDEAHIVCGNIIRYFDGIQELRDSHALRFKFEGNAKNVDLTRNPHYIQLHCASTFVRMAHLRQHSITFNEQMSNSEDAIFLSQLLAQFDCPITAVVPEAVYLYRKRSSLDSAVDTSYSRPGPYLDRFRFGYLPLLESFTSQGRDVPEWLGNLVLYEFKWLFERERSAGTRASSLSPAQRIEFLDLVRKCLSHVPDEWILGYRVTLLSLEIRLLWLAIKGSSLPKMPLAIQRLDQRQQLLQIRYYFVGDLPDESFRVRAKTVEPVAAKVRRLDYFGPTILSERIVWLAANSWLSADLNGVRQELHLGPMPPPTLALTEEEIWSHFDESQPTPAEAAAGLSEKTAGSDAVDRAYRRVRRLARMGLNVGAATKLTLRGEPDLAFEMRSQNTFLRVRSAGESSSARKRYKDAWVLMDRLGMAQDNAEHLYRYLQQFQPQINIWFVLERDSRDWGRLKADGFKLIEYGSERQILLMMNAAHLISSHIDHEHLHPISAAYYPSSRRQWRFTFLQHGVTKDDMSGWLNRKDLDLFVTATRPEYESIVSDETPYVFTSKEVVLTGFPRHDALLEKKRRHLESPGERLLLIAPTWRESLMKKKINFEPRTLVDDFATTEYSRAWSGLLHSAQLSKVAVDNNLVLAFLPHPGLQPFIADLDIPGHVRVIKYDDVDIQDVLAKVSLMVTDYSSLAFEAAFLHIPVAYFQFDQDSVFGGGHLYTKGYFDYNTDGFGPVSGTLPEMLQSVQEIATFDGAMLEPYRSRVDRTFEFRDGGCSERVFKTIALLNEPNKLV